MIPLHPQLGGLIAALVLAIGIYIVVTQDPPRRP